MTYVVTLATLHGSVYVKQIHFEGIFYPNGDSRPYSKSPGTSEAIGCWSLVDADRLRQLTASS